MDKKAHPTIETVTRTTEPSKKDDTVRCNLPEKSKGEVSGRTDEYANDEPDIVRRNILYY